MSNRMIKLTAAGIGTIAVGSEHILSVIPEFVGRSNGVDQVRTKVSVPGFTYTVREPVDQVLELISSEDVVKLKAKIRELRDIISVLEEQS